MKIRKYLEKYGIKQNFFAKKLGITISCLQYIMKGINEPRLKLAERIIQETNGEVALEDLRTKKPSKNVKNKI